MTNRLEIHHRTTYRYARPVTFREHRMMLRPRDSHDLRVLETALTILPASTTRWVHDVFGNSIAIATFSAQAAELVVDSRVRVAHYPSEATEIVVDPLAARYPFTYDPDDLVDLRSSLAAGPRDANDPVGAWARRFLGGSYRRGTLELVTAMNAAIHSELEYTRREEAGTYPAAETLLRQSGSCRDFAVLLIEAARELGIAARFVSGYLYDESADGGASAVIGSGDTHAWAELFLPGAGWVELDPTNGAVGGRNLIRVAVARMPSQAVPVAGAFVGAKDDYLGMDVRVSVRRRTAEVVADA